MQLLTSSREQCTDVQAMPFDNIYERFGWQADGVPTISLLNSQCADYSTNYTIILAVSERHIIVLKNKFDIFE